MSDRIAVIEAQLLTVTEPRAMIDLLNELAWLVREVDPRRGLLLSQKASKLIEGQPFAATPYIKGEAKTLRNLGWFNARLGRESLALSQLLEALSLFEVLGDVAAQTSILTEIAPLYQQAYEALQRQQQIADSLSEVVTVLNSSLDLEVVLIKIMEQLGRVIAYDSAALFLQRDNALVIFNGANLHQVQIGYRISLTCQDPAVRVFKERRSLMIGDVYEETGWQQWQEGDRIRSWVGTPLLTERRAIGVLTVDHAERNAYEAGDVQILQTFANQAALAIRNAWQVQRTEEALHGAGLLYRVGSLLAKTANLQQAIEKALIEYLWALNLRQGRLSLFDTERYGPDLQASYQDNNGQAFSPLRLDGAAPLSKQIIDAGRPLVIADAANDPRLASNRDLIAAHHIKSMLIAPLIVRGEVIGLLSAETTQAPRLFSDQERDLAQAVADQMATALDNARLFTEEHQQRELAESQNKELDAFARTVAHDIKNPLGSIVAYADFLANHFSMIETENTMEMIKTIRQAAHKGANIIDELLLLAGIRKLKVTSEPLDMDQIVLQAEARLAFMIDEYQGQLELPTEWPTALGYAPWVEEVWVNYLSNGLKYGGQPPCLRLGADRLPEGAIRFWVQDSGAGISPADQSHLFTEFTRLNEVRAQGHGLGLSIVRRIIKKLGGRVGVESSGLPGEGSRFYFTLPGAG